MAPIFAPCLVWTQRNKLAACVVFFYTIGDLSLLIIVIEFAIVIEY
jgi:hypothetical protein